MHIPAAFQPSRRLLMGPGPSMVADSVLQALSKPVLGHLDPEFVAMMEELKTMLRSVFQTQNELTFPVSGTGSAGMEFCVVNLVEPGDEVIVGVNGVFGGRMAEVAERGGARVTRVESTWGRIIEPQQIADALKKVPKPKFIGIVHAETSTGALTPVEEISKLAQASGALLLLDTVTSLGGCPVKIDEWKVDAVYSGTQKCLSCPPGLSPVSLSPRALNVATQRKTKVQSWYLDVNLLASYWGQARVYHHTAPISMNYGLHEALRLVLLEGLQARFERHRAVHEQLRKGLLDLGVEIVSQPGHQLWQLNALGVRPDWDEAGIRKRLLNEFQIEVGAGLGPMKGKIIRVGLMGETARPENVHRFLDALKACIS